MIALTSRMVLALTALANVAAGGDRPADLDLGVPEPASERGLRVGLSAGPAALVEVTKKSTIEGTEPEFDNYLGGGGALTLSYSLGIDAELLLSAFADVATASPGTVTALGGRVAARTDLVGPVFGGLAFSMGYLMTPDEPAPLPTQYEARSSVFVAPEIEPMGVRLGAREEIDVSLRLRVLFATQQDLGGSIHAPVFFSPSLGASYLFSL